MSVQGSHDVVEKSADNFAINMSREDSPPSDSPPSLLAHAARNNSANTHRGLVVDGWHISNASPVSRFDIDNMSGDPGGGTGGREVLGTHSNKQATYTLPARPSTQSHVVSANMRAHAPRDSNWNGVLPVEASRHAVATQVCVERRKV